MAYALTVGDGYKYELIDGTTYQMAPPKYLHNAVGGNLYRIIANFLHGKRCKVVYETMVYFDEKNKFIPDLVIVCDRSKIKADGIHGAPDLVIEILSPSTQNRDVGIKKDTYEKFGVKEYWLVRPLEKTIETYILQDGKFIFNGVYADIEQYEWDMLNDEERAEQKLTLKISLYPDFEFPVKEVFED